MGPWVHRASSITNAGEVDFGAASVLDLEQLELKWFDRWLKGTDNCADNEAPLKLFVMGVNQWRYEGDTNLSGPSQGLNLPSIIFIAMVRLIRC